MYFKGDVQVNEFLDRNEGMCLIAADLCDIYDPDCKEKERFLFKCLQKEIQTLLEKFTEFPKKGVLFYSDLKLDEHQE